MSLAAFPWRDRPLGRVASEVHRTIQEHGTAHVYVGNVFVRVAEQLDDHDSQYVGCYGRANSVDEIMRALDDALRDARQPMSRELRGAEAPDRLTHAEQFWLYQNDRMTWARYVAPHWKRMLEQADPVGKRNLWRLCEPELRAALNELKRNCA